MGRYQAIPEKVILKWNKELLELHKRVLTTYLASKGLSYRTRSKFFILYDLVINEKNIRSYFFTPTPIFVQAIVRGTQEQVATYIFSYNNGKPKRKRKANAH